jgi:predicted ATPase/DNA-binding CsgD family transcriptional regulator
LVSGERGTLRGIQIVAESTAEVFGHPDLAVSHNLPVPLTSFVGREREIASVSQLLLSNRMVTLLGTGGCGKTRLSLEVVARATDRFPDGIWFVELAPTDDPELVAQTVGAVIGVREQPGRDMVEILATALANRTALLVLDNCEHVVVAAANLASALLAKCPALIVLATTREQLGVAGEVTFTVPSLSAVEAAELFVERAARARPGFEVTSENATAVDRVCQRLDGIPLALELAAARTRVLSPEQICDGLTDRFRLLSSGARTVLPRHQTLRASVDWSFALLRDEERVALRRMSVFAGGFDLDAAERVVADAAIAPGDVLELLASLVDKSLVLTDDDGRTVRYRMLETIRQYGAERLAEAGEERDAERRHREHYCAFLRRAAAEEEGPDQGAWSARVRVELDNVRAALQSALHADDGAALLELTCGTGNTWTIIGRSSEHRRWLEEAIARAPDDSPLRASALYQLGITDMFAGDIAASRRHLAESIPLYRSAGDEAGALWAHAELAWTVAFESGFDAARPLYDEGIALARAAGVDGARYSMEFGRAQYLTLAGHLDRGRAQSEALLAQPAPVEHFGRWTQAYLAMGLVMLGEIVEALPLADDAVAYARAVDDMMVLAASTWAIGCARISAGDLVAARASLEETSGIANVMGVFNMPWALHGVALLALAEGDPASALRPISEAVEMARRMSAEWATFFEVVKADVLVAADDLAAARASLDETLHTAQVANAPAPRAGALVAMARVARADGALEQAEDHAHEALAIARPMRHKAVAVDALEVLGAIAADLDSHHEAARVLAGADALREACGSVIRAPTQQRDYAATMEVLRAALTESELAAAWTEGAAMAWDDVCDYAARGRGARKRPSTGWQSLTPAEQKVAALVAEGLTNPQVGARLFISRHTVDSHLRHVYAKLGVATRAELATRVARRDGADA